MGKLASFMRICQRLALVASTSIRSSSSMNSVWPISPERAFSNCSGRASAAAASPEIGQMRAQLLVYGLTVHCKSPLRLSMKRWYTPRSIGGLPATGDPPMSAASARAAAEGGRLSLRLQGPLVSKAASTTFSKRASVLGQAQRAALTGRQDLMGGQQSGGE